ncbi:Por secretion system C-terminal sorting domain-containing protein [Paenimyroides aquimaris]|uniref:Por secretion system C-terminal sorting domain-containing protein n=1 Tax=Paenimyroides marinum TaxID=1159016 RepID=A0A1H6M6V0_9FLAO|nr:T9SS type A sorting domain-containing protein [Paenimyroides aquimaris]SEH97104.1 Por secretion system C-terminal sorting domain-containing protein [Paenimyroides aquimaris]
MKNFYSLITIVAASFAANAQATIITQWDFDDPDYTLAANPTTGNGTFGIIGGVTENLNSNAMPVGNPSTGKAYSIKGFPAQGLDSGTAGYQFSVNTTGYENITLSFDPRSSNTGSKWMQYEMSTDGTTWTVLGNNNGVLANDFNNPVSLTLPTTADNQATLTFKLVSIFEPSTQAYTPVGTTSTYGTGGAWRIDNLTVSGEVITTSIKENNIDGLNIFPNPANDVLNITSNSTLDKNVQLFDLTGKKVLDVTTVSQVNISTLKAGIYVAKINEAGKTATRKVIIK